MNRLSVKRRAQVVRVLCEGNSIRGTSRITGAAVNTVIKLLRDLGAACMDYHDEVMVDLPCRRVQCDEIWSFVYSKAKNTPAGRNNRGNVWTWVAIDADTKLVPCWRVGGRTAKDAYLFMLQLESRLANRVQLTTDGLSCYIEAVEGVFGPSIDYAMLSKVFDSDVHTDPRRIQGRPDKEHISTSFVERQNLTMRMSMRRFARQTNAFSKKLENHMYAISLHFMFYNFCWPHRSLKGKTPAVVTGLADRRWSLQELVRLTG